MEANKENVRVKVKSKIPVPIVRASGSEPTKSVIQRDPLKTLAFQHVNQDLAGPSRGHDERNGQTSVVTPFCRSPGSLGPSTVKRVKSSLKRCCSRHTQGVTPCPWKHGEYVPRHKNREITRNTHRLSPSHINIYTLNQCHTDDVLRYLLGVEDRTAGRPKIKQASRSCVVNWMIKVNGRTGNPAAVQTACCFLDSYLSAVRVRLDELQVVAAACMWLATKLHGNVLSSARLVKCGCQAFDTAKLVATETMVVQILKFPIQPVVPDDFVPYLSWWCQSESQDRIEAAATFLCQCGVLVDKQLNREYASVVAAAAVQMALIMLGKSHLIKKLADCPVYKAAQEKAQDFSAMCAFLQESLRIVASVGYEYTAPIFYYSAPPLSYTPKMLAMLMR